MSESTRSEAVSVTDQEIAREFAEGLTTEAALEMMIDDATTAEERTLLAGLVLASSRSDASTIATLRKALQRKDEALRAAYGCMNYLGDILNNHDMVEPCDEKATAPAFRLVREALPDVDPPKLRALYEAEGGDPTDTFINVQRMSKADLLAYARRLEWWIAERLPASAALDEKEG